MNRQEARLYLSLVHCWDNQHAMNFKCVSTIMLNWNDPKLPNIVTNHAVQDLDDMLDLIELRMRNTHLGVYNAMGAFKMAGPDRYKDGYLKLSRKRENVVTLNSLYTDIDVKPGAYASTELALEALGKFCKVSGMPDPTIVVKSGSGGVHPYWCTAAPMSLAEWQPLAEALKEAIKQHGLITDAGVTADAARILRIPGTLNWKDGTAKPVELILPDRIVQYTVAGLAQVLQPYNVAQAKTGSGTSQSSAKPSAWAQSFGAGVADQAMPKLPIDAIAVNCPMVAATLMDGGAGKSEPEWSQDMFLSAFTLDPTDAAHRLSRGHVGYSPGSTDKKLGEKMAAIAANPKLGWPACASFNHAACKTCPLLRYGKSPITFAHQLKPQAQPAQPGYQVDDLMPDADEYWRNANDHVFTNGQYGPVDVLGYPILDGGIDPATGALVLKTKIGGKERWGSLVVAKHTGVGVCEALAKGTNYGIMVKADHQKIAMRFIMAWMSHLQTKRKFHGASGFGWADDGFVFGDQIYTPTGPVAAYRGDTDDDRFRVVGKLEPWRDAMDLVYDNPPLETIVASAFAAPLVTMACDHSVVMAVYSDMSGYGKSTAMKLAQAVWGDPRTGMSTLSDTENAVNKKATSLRNLPVYWDELKLEEQKEKMVSVIFSVTQGQTKARLNRDATQQKVNTATTMLVLATNRGIVDHVVRQTEGTDAGIVRVFEYEITKFAATSSAADASDLIRKISSNYGNAGAFYADFIARNKEMVEKVVRAVRDQLAGCRMEARERFWEVTMVTLIAGAHIANACGLTSFDVPAIQAHLVDSLKALRQSTVTNQPYINDGPEYGLDVLADLMSDIRGKHLIVTDIVPSGRGPVPMVQPGAGYLLDRLTNVWMQKGEKDGRIVVGIKAFNHWLVEHNHSPKKVRERLERDYHIVDRKVQIGMGIAQFTAMGRTNCYDLTPKPPMPSHNPSSPSSSSGSPAPTTPAS